LVVITSDDWPASQLNYTASRLVYYKDANSDDISEISIISPYVVPFCYPYISLF